MMNLYILRNNPHNKSSPYIVTIFFLVVRNFKVYCLSNFQICNTVITTVITLYRGL